MSRFSEFWPYYLHEHRHPVCRALHYLGSSLALAALLLTLWQKSFWFLLLIPLFGYGFAWIGHFAFEGNQPATFQHPWLSLRGDARMYRRWITGRLKGDLQNLSGVRRERGGQP